MISGTYRPNPLSRNFLWQIGQYEVSRGMVWPQYTHLIWAEAICINHHSEERLPSDFAISSSYQATIVASKL